METGVSGNRWSCPKEAKPIVLYDGEWCLALNPVQGNWSSFQIDLGSTVLFDIPSVTSLSSIPVKPRGNGLHLELTWSTPSYCPLYFWGTLCSSVKQIKAPYLFHWEQGIALHEMQWNRALFLSEGEVSWFFSSCGGNLGYILELRQG